MTSRTQKEKCLMKSKFEIVSIPFPPQLMSSSKNPTAMPVSFGREILNMFVLKSGAGAKRNGFKKSGSALEVGHIVKLMSYITSSGDVQILALADTGKLYEKVGTTWIERFSGFSANVPVRVVAFAGKLVMCNGVNPIYSWDGTALTPVTQWINDASSGLTYLSTSSFKISGSLDDYPVGRPVRATLGTATVQSVVQSATLSGTDITVTLATSVLNNNLSAVAYQLKPPPFSGLYMAHDRLWGFGTGLLMAKKFGNSAERSYVYYTHGLADETAWHDGQGNLPFLNLADKMPMMDEVIGMASKDGMTAFFFRNAVQVWTGADPSAAGDFAWAKTIPVGCAHGDLIAEMPNDIGFISRFGGRTLTRVLQTEQLDIDDFGSEIDPSLAAAVEALCATDTLYQKGDEVFRFDRQGWFGFRIAGQVFVFQAVGGLSGWSIFDGLFADMATFCAAPDSTLYAAKQGQLYVYDEETYDDDGAPIRTRWWTPWLNFSSSFRRWANKYIEVITDQGAPVNLSLKRYTSYNTSGYLDRHLTATSPADHWDSATWDEALWDNGAPRPETVRDRFVADVFSFALESADTAGPLTVFGMKLYGTRE